MGAYFVNALQQRTTRYGEEVSAQIEHERIDGLSEMTVFTFAFLAIELCLYITVT